MHEPYRYAEGRSPWALFLPIALAVFVGQLAAGWVGSLVGPRSGPEVAATTSPEAAAPAVPMPVDAVVTPVEPLPAPVAAPTPDSAVVGAAPAPEPLVVSPDVAEPAVSAVPDPPATDAGRSLPGPVVARQAGASESCINNTVATRSPNGWEQALENDAPVRCTATSP
ncbi:hypothetical protein [Luteimonas deserti]|uniref:Uncharacterized protein n=1 Tax=Luteimonas deserti TaxID=2752306 RepID=A0A7Z0TWZ7_9GAMM|nr:hypothetical protein [Luteimonas deserti]NYZ61265.1 hypothetical protein [Luteimonas deserti]